MCFILFSYSVAKTIQSELHTPMQNRIPFGIARKIIKVSSLYLILGNAKILSKGQEKVQGSNNGFYL